MMAAAASASESGELNIQDYSTISIEAADIEVSDETVMSYLDQMLADINEMTEDSAEPAEEISDQFIADHSLIYFGVQLDTVEEAKEYIKDTLEKNNLKDAVITQLNEMSEVISYPEDIYSMMKDYAADEIAYYAFQNDVDEDALAILSGYGSAEEYIEFQAGNYVKTSMIINRVLSDLNITATEEDRDAALEEYLERLGYDTYMTVDEFRETAGETWLFLFTEFQYKSGLMYDALESHIEIVR